MRDDLQRTRVTVCFRLILALPHLVWVTLFGTAAFVLAFVVWLAVLFERRAPATLHGFLASFTRYTVHLTAYLCLAADPYPGFTGAKPYPIDVEIDPPTVQGRWGAGFRLVLAVPALALSSALGGSMATGSAYGGALAGGLGGLTIVAGFLGWFAVLARGRMPRGMRDAAVYAIGYGAQTTAYLLMLTARYPDSTPGRVEPAPELPAHPVAIAVDGATVTQAGEPPQHAFSGIAAVVVHNQDFEDDRLGAQRLGEGPDGGLDPALLVVGRDDDRQGLALEGPDGLRLPLESRGVPFPPR